MQIKEILSESETPEVSVSLTGAHSGQKDMTMTVTIAGQTVAGMDFSEYRGAPSIGWIHVEPQYRMRKLGKLMVSELQRMYPDQEIDWGNTTPEGSRLYASIPHKLIPNPDIIRRVEHLKKIRRELTKLNNRLESMPADQRSKWIGTVSDRWNQYHDLESKLEHELSFDSQTHKKIVDLDGI